MNIALGPNQLYVESPDLPDDSAIFMFYPVVLEGEGVKILTARSVEDIACGNIFCRVKPQFKRMFWELLKVSSRKTGFPAIREITIFNGMLAAQLHDNAMWGGVCCEMIAALKRGLYPGKIVEVMGLDF
ncbi:MAG TPA: hypothetical protein P5080_05925 [Candidatus Paceibacterota bacterium]|nr:hypothetical protein [Candidatus Pacearchaeota archaeon]HRZ51453.1 hypothetical protein [Candidatus Paceibacterota bacterium]HSA37205.1 hypothetical protein [Candidatus Paceibacterota bacterium]